MSNSFIKTKIKIFSMIKSIFNSNVKTQEIQILKVRNKETARDDQTKYFGALE